MGIGLAIQFTTKVRSETKRNLAKYIDDANRFDENSNLCNSGLFRPMLQITQGLLVQQTRRIIGSQWVGSLGFLDIHSQTVVLLA
jgi:hypothetical protein